MPLISIRWYLDRFKPKAKTDRAPDWRAAACGILVNEVDSRLLADRGYGRLRAQWSRLAELLETLDTPGDLGVFQARAAEVLAERQRLEAVREQVVGRDVRQMLGLLNEALLSLAAGNEGSVDRLRRLETALHRTSQLNDLVAMKVSLTETMRLVRAETEQARTEGTGTLQRLDTELQRARMASQHLPGLPGRAEAMLALEGASVQGAPASLAVGCQLEALRIIRSRYGAPIADELLMAFAAGASGHEGDQAFRWSDDAVVILHRTHESAQEKRGQLEEQFVRPFEHRVMTGGRAALLSVPVRWLCTSPADPAPAGVVNEFEQFFEGRRWRP